MHAVVGTTGFTDDELAEFADAVRRSTANAVIAPNFAIGAVLMMRFAEMAAPFFETAEIIELHHDQKIDAPSGTAMLTAQRMAAASKDWADDPTTTVVADGARGGAGRRASPCTRCGCAGMVAHQEVLLGTTGQTPVDPPRHATTGRRSCPASCSRCARSPRRRASPIGLDALLGL